MKLSLSTWVQISAKQFDHQRKGQALMNALCMTDSKAYEKITGTDADPFYDDEKIAKFFDELKKYDQIVNVQHT